MLWWKNPCTGKIFSAAQAYRTAKKSFHDLFTIHEIQRNCRKKEKRKKNSASHNYFSSVGNAPLYSKCVRIWRLTDTLKLRTAHLFVPCVFVSQHPVSYSWFWGFSGANTIQSSWTENRALEKQQSVLNMGYEEGKNHIWRQSEEWVHVFRWEKAMKRKSNNMKKRKREREAGGRGRTIV